MIKWFFRVLAVLIVAGALFFLAKDYHQRHLDDGLLLQKAITKTLTGSGFRFAAETTVRDLEDGSVWEARVEDGKLTRPEPLLYNVSGTLQLQKDGSEILQEGFVYNYGNLYLDTQKHAPQGGLYLVPLTKGWKSFAAAHSYQDVLFDTYLPISIRGDLFKKGEEIEELWKGSRFFTKQFSFRPGNWLASLSSQKKSDHQASLSAGETDEFLAGVYDTVRRKNLNADQRQVVDKVLQHLEDLTFYGTVSEEGFIEEFRLEGTMVDRWEIASTWTLSETQNTRLVVKSPPAFQHYRDYLGQLTEEEKTEVLAENPTKNEELFDVLAIWSMTDDQDEDGLIDAHETFFGTNLQNPDTDGDGFSDYQELTQGFSPHEAPL